MSLASVKCDSFVFDNPSYRDYELIQFRLTDSALRDLEKCANTLGGDSFKICFSDTENSFTIPLPEHSGKFTFSETSLNNTADGSFDCLSINKGRLRCLGKVNTRLTVNAREDSFSMAKEKMAQLEDEGKKSQTKEIGQRKRQLLNQHLSGRENRRLLDGICYSDSKLNNSSIVDSHSISPIDHLHLQSPGNLVGSGPSPQLPNIAVLSKSLRERIIHVLALRPYQRSELICRLSRDGLTPVQRTELDSILSEVCRIGRRSAYHLLPSAIPELDPLWPGYTMGEKGRIISLKAKQQVPSSTLDSAINRPSSTSSPAALPSRLPGLDEEFARRPTLAIAPAAPHALSKKIAALDLLSNGVSELDVSSRLGVGKELLHRWRASERDLRERYSRQNSKKVVPSQSPVSNTLNTTGQPKAPSPTCVTDPKKHPNYGARRNLTNDPSENVSVTKECNIFPPKRPCLGQQTSSSDLDTCVKPIIQTLTDPTVEHCVVPDRRLYSSRISDEGIQLNQVRGQSHLLSPSSLQDSIPQTLFPDQRQSQFGSVGCGTGSGGESASHTPCSVSSGSSSHGTTAASNPSVFTNNNNNVRPNSGTSHHDRERNLARSIRPVVNCDIDGTNNRYPVIPDQYFPENDNVTTKLSLHGTSCSDGFADVHSGELDLELAKIKRRYPKISTADQIERYRAEFESTYPTYLQMYHSFTDIWKAVSNLGSRLLRATKTEGLDSQITTNLAGQLDALMMPTRSAEYRQNEAQLTLITYKLNLLKQRLFDAKTKCALLVHPSLSATDGISYSQTETKTHTDQRSVNGSIPAALTSKPSATNIRLNGNRVQSAD